MKVKREAKQCTSTSANYTTVQIYNYTTVHSEYQTSSSESERKCLLTGVMAPFSYSSSTMLGSSSAGDFLVAF